MVIGKHRRTINLFFISLIFLGFLLIKNPIFQAESANLYTTSQSYEKLQQYEASGNALITLNDIDSDILPKFNYSDLNTKWKEKNIEMLIITPQRSDFVQAMRPLMEWKNQKGVTTIILRNFSDYEGKDNAEKIRNMIKSYKEKYDIKWVLLAGDAEEDLIPIREVYNPDVVEVGQGESEYSDWSDYYKPTDYYYADLNGTWDTNKNEIYGESSQYTGDIDEIEWIPDVYVGRFPAISVNDLEKMVNKTLKYETDPYVGNWMNRMLLAGGVSSLSPLEDEAQLTTYIWQEYVLSEMNFTHLYRTSSPYDPPTPPDPNQDYGLTHNSFNNHLNLGYSTVLMAGHGYPTKFNDVFGDIYLSSDSSNNYNMPSLIYSDACMTSSYDKNDNNVGEILIKRVDSGAIGYIGGLRVTWYFENDPEFEKLNRANAKLFWQEFFENEKYQPGKALYDSKVSYMNTAYFTDGEASLNEEWERKNLLTYSLLGDPEIDIYTDIPVGIKNPFKGLIYECEKVSAIIKNDRDEPVSNARVHVYTSNGLSRTFYSDSTGNVEFTLPEGRRLYNVTITGHNIIASNFNFRTTSDSTIPELEEFSYTPKNPTVSDNLNLTIQAEDAQTGIESVHAIISNDNFSTFSMKELSCSSNGSKNQYQCDLDKLEPGEYSLMILARDMANNTAIFYNQSLKMIIPKPIIDYVLNVSFYFIIGILGFAFYIIYYQFKSFKKLEQEFNESNRPS